MTDFERSFNVERREVARIYETYKVLTVTPVDEYGDPLPERVTGYDVVPPDEHDVLTAIAIRDVFGGDPLEIVERPASEVVRLMALARASQWSQPTKKQQAVNKQKKFMGRR